MKFLLLTVVICLIYALVSVAASPLINEARRTSCAIVGTDCSTLPCCEDLTCARTPKLLCIYGRYNYSAEDGFEIKVDENETICNLVETIKQMDLSSDTLSDKLAFLEANPSTNIKRTLDGEELTATETAIFEYFDNTELQSSQQTEGENSIEDDTKSVTPPKKMEEKCDSNDTSYNRNLSNPIVSIKS
ncbi:20437_t:CDS:2, partial [Rhizophagus irregularis]